MRICSLFFFVCGAFVFLTAQNRPLSLREGITLYKARHRHAEFAVELAKAEVITAGLRPNPILNNQSLQLGDPKYHFPGTRWNEGYNRQVWWQLTKPMLLPGVRERKIGFAEASLNAQAEEAQEYERGLLLQFSEAWISSWLAHRRRQCFDRAKRNSDSVMVTGADNDKECKLSQKEFELRVKMVSRHDDKTFSELQLLSDGSIGTEVDTSVSSISELILMADGLATTSMAAAARTDEKSSVLAVAAANLKMQKALAWPVPELGAIYNPQNTIPYLGVFATIHIPVFSRNQGEIRKAQLQFEQAQINYKLDEQSAPLKAEEKRQAYLNARSNLADYKEILSLSNAVYEKELTEKGKDGCQLLKKRIALLERELHYLDAQAEFFRALVAFLSIKGVLDENGK